MAAYVMVLLGGGLAGACGSGDDNSKGSVGASGVDGQKLLTDLSKDDNRKLCEYSDQQYKRLALASKEQYCTVVGIDSAASADTCEQAKQKCLDGTDYEDELKADPGCATHGLLKQDVKGPCTATVADVEACIREDAQREAAIGTNYTCANAGDEIPEEEGDGPVCSKVFDDCPGADF